MAKRTSSMPLYEAMARGRNVSAAELPSLEPAEDDDVEAEPAEALAGGSVGRSVRVPVGTLLAACALVVILLVVAYIAGSERQRIISDAKFDAMVASGVIDPSRNARDPLALGGAGGAGGGGENGAETGGERPQPRVLANRGGTLPDGLAWGPIDTDPRQAGLNYMVLAETRAAGARRLAEFCRDEGLEAYVVSSNNHRLRRVIVLPALTSREQSDPGVARLTAEVGRVGLAWKSSDPGESDLSDAYIVPYEP